MRFNTKVSQLYCPHSISWDNKVVNKQFHGEPGTGLNYQDHCKEGSLWGESGGRIPLLGTPKDMLRFWKWASVSIGALFGERSPPRAFERRVKFLFIRRTFMRNSKDVLKKVLKTGNSLHKGHQWGTWRGFNYLDFLRQMKEGSGNRAPIFNLIWAPFWIQITLGAWVWGQSGTSVKVLDSHDLVSAYEAQRAYFKTYVHWDWEGLNPITILFYSKELCALLLHSTH